MRTNDRHVALLLSNPLLSARHVNTTVLTQQVAPTILKSLDLDPDRLDAVRKERIPVLPFFFGTDEE